MRVVFYKGPGNFFDKLIRWWTDSPYSHCELMFADGNFFSADPRGGGVRYKKILFEEAKWDFVEIPMDTFDENMVRRWCNGKVGKGYDWWGILFSQVLPFGGQDPNRYFCSEVCVEAIQKAGKLKGIVPYTVSPKLLAKMFLIA